MTETELQIYKKALDEVALVVMCDKQGNINYINDKYYRLVKYLPEEIIGTNIRSMKSDFHTHEFYDTMYHELEKGNIFRTKIKNKAKDNTLYYLDATIIPFLDKNSEPYQYLAILFDITEKMNETVLKEELLADISHEIRTPLHGILSFIDLLSETEPDEKQTEYINYIKETSAHLEYLVNDLLDIFKTNSGKLNFEFKPFDTKNLIKSIVDMMSLREKTHKIRFVSSLDEHINDTLMGDPNRLIQILCNLLNNSIDHTETGIITLQAGLAEETSDNQVIEFCVIDTGVVITEEKQKEMYGKFRQSKVKDPQLYCSTGLGMNIVKKLIELQKGSYSMESVQGEGSAFKFRIPYKKTFISGEENKSAEEDNPEKTEAKHKLLIAEDDKINQMIFSKQMNLFHYDFKLAEDGFKALELLQHESFDLVLLDMQMPGMNGDEVLHKIRTEFTEPVRQIPVICITATIHPATIQALIEAGANGYLSKPYKAAELKSVIDKALSETSSGKDETVIPAQEPQDSIIQLATLNQFADGDNDFITELLTYFKSTTPDVLTGMQQNFNSNNKELAGQLHKYRSQVSLLGITELTELTRAIETAIQESIDFSRFRDDFDNLTELSHKALEEVDLLINRLKNT